MLGSSEEVKHQDTSPASQQSHEVLVLAGGLGSVAARSLPSLLAVNKGAN